MDWFWGTRNGRMVDKRIGKGNEGYERKVRGRKWKGDE